METAVERKCKIDQCKGRYRAKGYCTRHYRKWRKGAYRKTRYKCCTQPDCRKPMGLNGLCQEHRQAGEVSQKEIKTPEKSEESEKKEVEAEKTETLKEDQK